MRRRAEGAEEARALLQEQLTAEKAAAAAAEMSLTQALILSRTATAQADFDRERAALEARTRRAEAARQRQRNAVLAREVTRQEVCGRPRGRSEKDFGDTRHEDSFLLLCERSEASFERRG